MIKRILIITAIAFTISGGTAQAANEVGDGGQYPKMCWINVGGPGDPYWIIVPC